MWVKISHWWPNQNVTKVAFGVCIVGHNAGGGASDRPKRSEQRSRVLNASPLSVGRIVIHVITIVGGFSLDSPEATNPSRPLRQHIRRQAETALNSEKRVMPRNSRHREDREDYRSPTTSSANGEAILREGPTSCYDSSRSSHSTFSEAGAVEDRQSEPDQTTSIDGASMTSAGTAPLQRLFLGGVFVAAFLTRRQRSFVRLKKLCCRNRDGSSGRNTPNFWLRLCLRATCLDGSSCLW